MKEKIYFDGRLRAANYRIPLVSRSFLYGEVLFTSMRTKMGKFPFWEDHWDRLSKGQFFLFPETSPLEWKKTQIEVMRGLQKLQHSFASRDFYVRVMLWAKFPKRSSDNSLLGFHHVGDQIEFALWAQPWGGEDPFSRPVTLAQSHVIKLENKNWPSFLKIPNYGLVLHELREKKTRGIQDIFYLTNTGKVAEASFSNIFIIKKGIVYTPRLSSCVLAGVIRKNLIACLKKNHRKVFVQDLDLSSLKRADEIFLTNSVKGIVPVKEIILGTKTCLRKKIRETQEIHSIFSHYLLRFLI